MILEAILSFLHLSAIFALIVFLTSEAALCRMQWMNAAVVERLVRVDTIYVTAVATVLVTGLARIFFGIKGAGWYGTNWLLYLKVVMFLAAAALAVPPSLAFRRWRRQLRATGALPEEAEVRRMRLLIMVQGHIVPLIPLPAVFLARGYGGF